MLDRRLLVLLVAALAGCASNPPGPNVPLQASCIERIPGDGLGEDWSTERIVWTLDSDGPFTVRLPFPTTPAATTLPMWLANLTFTPGWMAKAVDTTSGPLVEVEGTGAGSIASCSVQPSEGGNGCCAEAYFGATWPSQREDTVAAESVTGQTTVALRYDGQSRWGAQSAELAPTRLASGHNDLRPTFDGYIE